MTDNTETNAAIEIKDLCKKIDGRIIVNNVNMRIQPGTMFALLGPNGAGKTTTTRLITGMLHPSKGEILINGTPMNDDTGAELRSIMGIQVDGNAYMNMTVLENLKLWADIYDVPVKEMNERIERMILNFTLDEYKDMPVRELSKGNRQKVLIARALIPNPRMVFLDEPTSGIDPQSAAGLMNMLHDMCANHDCTVFMNTHRLQGLDGIVDSIGVMENGVLVETGKVSDMIHERWPRKEYELVTEEPYDHRLIDMLVDWNEDTGFIEIKPDVEPYQVLETLLKHDVHVNEFNCRHRTIQDLYLDKVKAGDWEVSE